MVDVLRWRCVGLLYCCVDVWRFVVRLCVVLLRCWCAAALCWFVVLLMNCMLCCCVVLMFCWFVCDVLLC